MIRKTIILLLVLFSNKNFAADFILSAPPTETRKVSVTLYEPIAQYISDVFDIDVAYEYPDNWPVYIRNMQKARYDFLVDAPHFVSWRVEKIEHNPLVSLSDELQYIVAVPDKSTVQGIMDLKGKSCLCVIHSEPGHANPAGPV